MAKIIELWRRHLMILHYEMWVPMWVYIVKLKGKKRNWDGKLVIFMIFDKLGGVRSYKNQWSWLGMVVKEEEREEAKEKVRERTESGGEDFGWREDGSPIFFQNWTQKEDLRYSKTKMWFEWWTLAKIRKRLLLIILKSLFPKEGTFWI